MAFGALARRAGFQVRASTAPFSTGSLARCRILVIANAQPSDDEWARGRAAFFGEAAMFSAQVAGPNRVPMGMNARLAEQNPQFVLNVLRWLSGVIEP